ncbi:MAG TPA: TIR domain-containing protein [Blastocatellia bacterium]|nr:TIR domain-containing protein [Blastocatellia bacterium]
MKVFLSWSGERSRAIAEALREWIPNVIQAVQPWMSAEDIDKGLRWSSEVAIELEQTRFGIICITPENLGEPWILFEAGALSKLLDKSFVCPFLFGLEPTDVKGPLIQFQATRAEKADVKKLILTLNRAQSDSALSTEKLENAFEHWWPELEKALNRVPVPVGKPKATREVREMVEEILEIVRAETRDRELFQVQSNRPSSDVNRIKAALEAKRKMMIVIALDKGTMWIDGVYLRVDYAPQHSKYKTDIEARDKRNAIEDACEEVLGRRLTLRASISEW